MLGRPSCAVPAALRLSVFCDIGSSRAGRGAGSMLTLPPGAGADQRGLSRYIKKKQLDPLVTYVGPVLEARRQLVKAGKLVGQDAAAARSMLRTGALDGVRDNIRALGEYSVQNSQAQQQTADDLVRAFFQAIQAFDYTLFQAQRSGTHTPPAAEAHLQDTLGTLDRLLATVPRTIVDEAQAKVDMIDASKQSLEEEDAAALAASKRLTQLLARSPQT
ncbi:hypothetical protein WJX72_012507 [[Myrmecia] bisecta]|uniref:DUF7880 domain-containing protein n=1 Tax=[Myrmecia] bisecta TaxID=41462 RepID=A0AAW1Q8U2_9CHLO